MSMWTLPEEDSEDIPERDRLVPTLSCDLTLPAGVTDLCFIDEHFLVVSLEDGSVQMLKYIESAKVSITFSLPMSVHRSMKARATYMY